MKKLSLENLTEKDREFLEKASRFLDIRKYGEFLLLWMNALESYGTPREFVDATDYKFKDLEFKDRKYPFVYTLSANYEQRAELMRQQKPYIPKKQSEEYGKLDINGCFLCQNIAQAIDARDHPEEVANNVIYWLGSSIIKPNRYPNQYGHSLHVPLNHDDTISRVQPKSETITHQDGTAVKRTIYNPEQGKTRGNIQTIDYLAELIEACDEYHLVAVRNHVLDGMSLPDHDHWHLMPEDLPSVSLIDKVVGERKKTDYGPTIFTPQNTPFDTLMVCAVGNIDIPSVTYPILKRMELADQVFTLVYSRGKLFISPRSKDRVNDRRQQIGAGVPMHYFDTEGIQFINRVNRIVPMKFEFHWEKYVD